MKKFFLPFLLAFSLVFFYSCSEKQDEVPSGTYTGKVSEVEAAKTEIYVKTDDGKTLELYFTPQTTLTQNGQTVPFETLKEGQTVEVNVNNVGGALDPVSVDIK